MLNNVAIEKLEKLLIKCDSVPWTSVVEGRDSESGDSFIQTGVGEARGEDIYVTRDSGPASAEYLDLIAQAVTALPHLIEEVRKWRADPASTDIRS